MADNINFPFHLVVTAGDDRQVELTFKTEAGVAVDISTWDFYYTAKADFATADASAEISLDPTDFTKTDSGTGTTDRITFTVSTAGLVVGTYFQDLQRIIGTAPTTLGVGKLIITDQVTQRVAPLP